MGGTFDPIHNGHIQMAEALYLEIKPDEFYFLPNYEPPHRAIPSAKPQLRLEMLKASLKSQPKFKIEPIEFDRKGASYTVETLKTLKKNLHPSTRLGLILGTDAFLSLNTWHKPEELSALCHIILVNRKDVKSNLRQINALTESLFGKNRLIRSIVPLTEEPSGFVYLSEVSPPNISATSIRAKLKNGKNVAHLLPKAVLDIIVSQGLYLA